MKNLITAIFCVICLQGCAIIDYIIEREVYDVDVNSFSDDINQNKKTYYIYPYVKDQTINSLQFKSHVKHIEKAMETKGFIRKENMNNAELHIVFQYFIGNPETRYEEYLNPIWGEKRGNSYTTQGTINRNGTYTATTVNDSQFGVIGYNKEITKHTVYTSAISLTAFDAQIFRETKQDVKVWTTSASSVGKELDLRKLVKVMSIAIEEYIGTDTGEYKKVIIPVNDPRLTSVK